MQPNVQLFDNVLSGTMDWKMMPRQKKCKNDHHFCSSREAALNWIYLFNGPGNGLEDDAPPKKNAKMIIIFVLQQKLP